MNQPYSTHKNKYKLLLVTLAITFFVAPFLKGGFNSIFAPLMLLSAILLVTRSFSLPKFPMSAYTVIAVIGYLLHLGAGLGWLQDYSIGASLIGRGIFALYLGGAAYWIVKDLFKTPEVTADTIRGGISVYLLIGFVWALFYGMVATINPAAFSQPILASGTQAYERTFHFSFTTLTTLGYGDIVPVSEIAQVLTNLEAIVGQMYSTVFIAILVGGYLSRRT